MTKLPPEERIKAAVIELAEGKLGARRLEDAAAILENLVKLSHSYKSNRR